MPSSEEDGAPRGVCRKEPELWAIDAPRADHEEAATACGFCPSKQWCWDRTLNRTQLDVRNKVLKSHRLSGLYAGWIWHQGKPYPLAKWHDELELKMKRKEEGTTDEVRECVIEGCFNTFTVSGRSRNRRVCSDLCAKRRSKLRSAAAHQAASTG